MYSKMYKSPVANFYRPGLRACRKCRAAIVVPSSVTSRDKHVVDNRGLINRGIRTKEGSFSSEHSIVIALIKS